MMTTMAAMLGALPLALGAGDGAEMRRPLGIAIVGGLIVSQMLTLYTTPVVYLYLDRFRLWAAQRARKRRARCASAVHAAADESIAMKPSAADLTMQSARCVARCRGRRSPAAWSAPTTCGPSAPAPADVQGSRGLESRAARATTRRAARGGKRSTIRSSIALASAGRHLATRRSPPRPRACARRTAATQAARAAALARRQRERRRARNSRSSRGGGNASGSTSSSTQHSYNVALDASWELDLWGGIRRGIEASDAIGAGERRGSRRRAAFGAGARSRRTICCCACRTRRSSCCGETVAAYERSLQLTQQPVQRPASSRAATSRRPRRSSKSTQAQVLDARIARAQLEHAVAVLVGKPPAELSIAPRELAAVFPTIPLARAFGAARAAPRHRGGRAARRERQCADRRRAGGVLPVAHAVGATAACRARCIGRPAVAAEPLLVARRRARADAVRRRAAQRAKRRRRSPTYDETVATYRATVLTGFQEVEDNLVGAVDTRTGSRGAGRRGQGARANRRRSRINQYKAGTANYLAVVVLQASGAQQRAHVARDSRPPAHGQRRSDQGAGRRLERDVAGAANP